MLKVITSLLTVNTKKSIRERYMTNKCNHKIKNKLRQNFT